MKRTVLVTFLISIWNEQSQLLSFCAPTFPLVESCMKYGFCTIFISLCPTGEIHPICHCDLCLWNRSKWWKSQTFIVTGTESEATYGNFLGVAQIFLWHNSNPPLKLFHSLRNFSLVHVKKSGNSVVKHFFKLHEKLVIINVRYLL